MTVRSINQSGITIVELIVVMVMTGVLTTVIMSFTVNYWRYGYLLEADLSTLSTRLNAGDFLRSAIAPSSGLIIQNSIADLHPGSADPAIASGQFWTPLHAVPGTIPVGTAGATKPLLYYKRPSANASGNYIMNGTQPYEDEFVLYMDGTSKSLRQRTLANPNAAGNKIKTSCPALHVTASCPADKIIATDLASIDMRYFSRTGSLMNYTSSTDPSTGAYNGPDFTAVEVVEFNLNLVKKPIFHETNATSNSTIIRIALRNG